MDDLGLQLIFFQSFSISVRATGESRDVEDSGEGLGREFGIGI